MKEEKKSIEYDDFDKKFTPDIQRQKLKKKNRKLRERNDFKRSFSSNLKREPVKVMITMLYYGKGINIPFDTQMFESKDEIKIFQQHCGGENVLVYSGLHEAGG